MLIDSDQIHVALNTYGIIVNGAFHIGAHDCEEISFYDKLGISPDSTVWIEALQHKVTENKTRGIPNVYNAVITDKDDDDVLFNISNNMQSSSVLEFGTHAQEHPHVVYIGKIQMKSTTIDTFFERNQLDASKYDFWNFDIQGAELLALKGGIKSIQHAKAIYLEVNERELYTGCGLIDEIDILLAQYNFKRVLTSMTQHGWGDALYVLAPR